MNPSLGPSKLYRENIAMIAIKNVDSKNNLGRGMKVPQPTTCAMSAERKRVREAQKDRIGIFLCFIRLLYIDIPDIELAPKFKPLGAATTVATTVCSCALP